MLTQPSLTKMIYPSFEVKLVMMISSGKEDNVKLF